MEIRKSIIDKTSFQFIQNMTNFEKNLLENPYYTPEYKAKMNKVKRSTKTEHKQKLTEKEDLWNKIFDWDSLELKPNIAGLGINFNKIINNLRKQ